MPNEVAFLDVMDLLGVATDFSIQFGDEEIIACASGIV